MSPTPITSTGPAVAPQEAARRAEDEFAEAGERQPAADERRPAPPPVPAADPGAEPQAPA
ncbi:hypothetical protein CLD22_23935 [Rubrivivax gelatinosus]|nr:hypothetical protein [Rubrivivax gelatinosus]